jgi:hypothetical protein
VLVNAHTALERDGQRLYLAGVDDLLYGKPDLGAALRGVPEGACAIVLCHVPDIIYDERAQRADLALAGHTHGGQVLWSNKLITNCKYERDHPHGLYREGGTQIYVTSGVGVTWPPVRLGVRPEVVVVKLVSSQTAGK